LGTTVSVADPELTRLRIDVWSDVICPWCHLGLAYLDRALAEFEHADAVDVVLHSFELDPTAPVRDEVPMLTRIAQKYGTTEEQVEASQARIRRLGEEVGLDLRFDQVVRGSTFDAHRLIHLAHHHGRQHEAKRALFRAVFTEGAAVGEHDTLRAVAAEVGLPADAVDDLLAGDRFAEAVRADTEVARRMGVTGVPYFLFNGEVGFGGAQPPERMLKALRAQWSDLTAASANAGLGVTGEGDVCGPEACER
jgi:predicted DsbA family dithiol-disulfide isomerase